MWQQMWERTGNPTALGNLACTQLLYTHEYALSEKHFQQAYEVLLGKAKASWTSLAITRGSLGTALLELGKLDEAEPLLVEALRGYRSYLDEQSFNTLKSCDNQNHQRHVIWFSNALTTLLRKAGRHAEAWATFGGTIADSRECLGPQHAHTLEAEAVGAMLTRDSRDEAAGTERLRQVVKRMREFLGSHHPFTLRFEECQ